MATFSRLHSRRHCATLFALGTCLNACSSERPRSDQGDVGAIRGELSAYVARFDDGRSETSYTLRVDGDERDLRFDADPGLLPGSMLKV